MFLYILTIKVATADRLTGLIATRVRDAQCNQVCGHLEDSTDYAECRALCSGHHETQRLLCRLPACDAVCQTACASHTGVKQEIQEFTLDGCTLVWETKGQPASNSILTNKITGADSPWCTKVAELTSTSWTLSLPGSGASSRCLRSAGQVWSPVSLSNWISRPTVTNPAHLRSSQSAEKPKSG